MQDYDFLYKIIIIGDSGVGKSNILMRFTDDMFSSEFISTIGVDFKIHSVQQDGKKVKLQIWDTAGQERFLAITRSYFVHTNVAVVVYDKTSRTTFEHINYWMEELDKKCNSNCLKVIVANKSDLVDQEEINFAEGSALAEQYGIPFLEVSAKDDKGIDDIFATAVRCLLKKGINENSAPIIQPLQQGKKVSESCGC